MPATATHTPTKPDFGDRRLIAEMYRLEAMAEAKARRKQALESGELKRFMVSIEYVGEYEKEVMAADEAAAKQQAQEMAGDIGMYEIDFDTTISVRPIRG